MSQRAEWVLVLFPVMCKLPMVHGTKRQRQPGRLAENLLVVTKQLGTPQRIDEFPVCLGTIGAGLGVVILAGFKVKEVICRGDEKSIANRIRHHQQNRDDSGEAPCTWVESICLRAACNRFIITTLMRLKSS